MHTTKQMRASLKDNYIGYLDMVNDMSDQHDEPSLIAVEHRQFVVD